MCAWDLDRSEGPANQQEGTASEVTLSVKDRGKNKEYINLEQQNQSKDETK